MSKIDGNIPAPSKIGQLMTQLPIDKLFPHQDNPRKDLGDLTELADSIKANGIFQNLTVVPADNTEEFIHGLTWTQKTAEAILQGALIAGVLKTIDYMNSDREAMGKALGLEEETSSSSERGIKALAALQNLDVKQTPSAIYALFDDSTKESYASGYSGDYPGYKKTAKLDGLYLWLTSLGYQMSDEEKALQAGTHELYHMKESEEKAKEVVPGETV